MPHVERNPLRGESLPIRKAQRWPWSSAGAPPRSLNKLPLDPGPVLRRRDSPAR
jgi:hypothetical protein